MPSIQSVLPAMIGLLTLSNQVQAIPTPTGGLIKRLGCYGDSSDVSFYSLHGLDYSGDVTQEVKNDIHTTCTKAAGKTIKPSEPFWLCTNWEKTAKGKSAALECYESCQPGIDISGSNSAIIDAGVQACRDICKLTRGEPDLADDGWNHIDWAIEVRGGQTEQVITYETCKAAFETELGGCASGSEQNHDGFWFRIDPNARKCPA